MAVAPRSSNPGNAASGALSLTIPTGTTTGDVLFAAWQASSASATWTGPAGWVQFGSTVNGGALYWRVWQAGDANPSATPSTGSSAGVIVSVSGADTLTPTDFGSLVTVASTTNSNTGAFHNKLAGSLFLAFAFGVQAVSFTEQVSLTELQDVSTASRPGLMACYEATSLTADTDQAARTIASNSGSNSGQTIALAIRPAGDPSIACDSFTGLADSQLITTASATPATLAHRVGVGANRMLVATLKTAVTQAGAPTTAKWTVGGVDQNLVLLDSNNTSPAIYYYYLLAPNSGAGTITFVLQTSSRQEHLAQSFANVHQTTPWRTGQVSGNGATTTTHLFSTTAGPSVTLATSAGDWAIDATCQAAANTLAMTAQTSRLQTDNGTTTGGRYGGSLMVTPAASQALAWTYGGSAAQSTIAAALVQASTTTDATATMNLVTAASSVFAAAGLGNALALPNLLTETDSVLAVTATGAGKATPNLLTEADSIFAATATGTALVLLHLLTETDSLYSATGRVDITAAMNLLSEVASLYSVTATGNGLALPGLLTVADSLLVASGHGNALATLALQVLTDSLYSAAATGDAAGIANILTVADTVLALALVSGDALTGMNLLTEPVSSFQTAAMGDGVALLSLLTESLVLYSATASGTTAGNATGLMDLLLLDDSLFPIVGMGDALAGLNMVTVTPSLYAATAAGGTGATATMGLLSLVASLYPISGSGNAIGQLNLATELIVAYDVTGRADVVGQMQRLDLLDLLYPAIATGDAVAPMALLLELLTLYSVTGIGGNLFTPDRFFSAVARVAAVRARLRQASFTGPGRGGALSGKARPADFIAVNHDTTLEGVKR